MATVTPPDGAPSSLEELPLAVPHAPPRRPGLIWLLPLLVALVGGWLLYRAYVDQGPTITLTFATAEGIEAGQTPVKYLDVDVGRVAALRFNDDVDRVEAEVILDHGMTAMLTATTRFWVVRPRVGAGRVSGLGTLLSGAYIAMDPGAGGQPQRRFDGLDEPPRILSHQQGRFYLLRAEQLAGLSVGAPVYFRQIQVGAVARHRLADDYSHVEVEVFIEHPHHRQVRQSSRFWNTSGLALEATADGLNLKLASLAALVAGGIAFETPDPAAPEAADGHRFQLYRDERELREAPFRDATPMIAYFEDSVRGLSVGAPVEYQGIPLGQVRALRLETDADTGRARIAVDLVVALERLDPDCELASAEQQLAELVARGLRASLRSGNLLTGRILVDLDYHADAPPVAPASVDGRPVLPTLPNDLTGVPDRLLALLSTLEQLPIAATGDAVARTAEGLDALINDPALARSLQDLQAASAALRRLLDGLATDGETLGKDTTTMLRATGEAAQQTEATLATAEALLDEQGVLTRELLEALRQFSAAAQSVRIMAEYLQRNPEALLQGKRSR